MSDDPAETDGDGTDDHLADVFENSELEDVDQDEVWAELDADAGDGEAADGDLFERLAEENPSQEPSPEVDPEDDTAVVPKNRYCQRCEYFSDPPELRCGHPGTTIEEVVDAEQFRVRNCPVVAERQGASDVLDME